jgi:hypothetical protein
LQNRGQCINVPFGEKIFPPNDLVDLKRCSGLEKNNVQDYENDVPDIKFEVLYRKL